MPSKNNKQDQRVIARHKRYAGKKGHTPQRLVASIITATNEMKTKVEVKASELGIYLRSQNLTRKSQLIYNKKSRKLVGRIQGLQPLILGARNVQKLVYRQRAIKNNYVNIIFDKPLTVTELDVKVKTKTLMANSTSTAPSMIKNFNDFPADVKESMILAHQIALIYRLKKEPFQKVATSCLPEDDVYVASFKGADSTVLDAELKRLRGLRK